MDDNTDGKSEVRLSVRLPDDLHMQITELSKGSGISKNGEIIRLLRMALDTRIAKFPDFWLLPVEERLSALLEGYGRYVTKEIE